jgi:hypothetical protein
MTRAPLVAALWLTIAWITVGRAQADDGRRCRLAGAASFPVKGPLELSLGAEDGGAPRSPCISSLVGASALSLDHDSTRAWLSTQLLWGRAGLGVSYEAVRVRAGSTDLERGDLWLGLGYQLPRPTERVLGALLARLQLPTATLGSRFGGELGLALGIEDLEIYGGIALTAPVIDHPGNYDDLGAVGVFNFSIQPWIGTAWIQPILEVHSHIGRVRRLGPMAGVRLHLPATGLTLSAAAGYMFGDGDGAALTLNLGWQAPAAP